MRMFGFQSLKAGAFAASILGAMTFAQGTHAFESVRKADAVAELFTSQGCSSCPPADALWKELSARDDILMLTLPIDYWDHLGWRDTQARPEHTARQKAYATNKSRPRIFTPEAVINGADSVIGSDRGAVLRGLDDGLAAEGDVLNVTPGADGLTIRLAESSTPVTLWMVVYRDETTVSIQRGENGGRTIDYINVVERMEPVSDLAGKVIAPGTEMTISEGELALEKGQNCALILQEGTPDKPGRMLSATIIDGV